jgi:hypothetical protein
VIRDAASVDAEIDALWQRIEREFRSNQRAVVELLHAQGALRAELEAWLADLHCAQLLAPSDPTG